jgi:hypothetical protein
MHDTAQHAVSVAPLYSQFLNPLIETVLQGLALAIAGWITWLIQRYAPSFLKGFLEAKAAKDLNTALANGVVIAMHQVEGFEKMHSDIAVKGAITAWAAQYAIDHAPGAVSKFGLSPDQLAVKALAYVPVPTTTTDTSGTVIAAAPVSVSPLPDVPGAKKE